MNTTFATIIHAAPKLDVTELVTVRQHLSKVLAPEFVRECDSNYDLINSVVSLTLHKFYLDDDVILIHLFTLKLTFIC